MSGRPLIRTKSKMSAINRSAAAGSRKAINIARQIFVRLRHPIRLRLEDRELLRRRTGKALTQNARASCAPTGSTPAIAAPCRPPRPIRAHQCDGSPRRGTWPDAVARTSANTQIRRKPACSQPSSVADDAVNVRVAGMGVFHPHTVTGHVLDPREVRAGRFRAGAGRAQSTIAFKPTSIPLADGHRLTGVR
jgi:hypothetical protein